MKHWQVCNDWSDEKYPRFMTNLDASMRAIVAQAAQETGYTIEVSDTATDMYGNVMRDNIAVYATERRDHTAFWLRYRELKDAQDV